MGARADACAAQPAMTPSQLRRLLARGQVDQVKERDAALAHRAAYAARLEARLLAQHKALQAAVARSAVAVAVPGGGSHPAGGPPRPHPQGECKCCIGTESSVDP